MLNTLPHMDRNFYKIQTLIGILMTLLECVCVLCVCV